MQRGFDRSHGTGLRGCRALGLVLTLALAASPARGQIPQPTVPEMAERSGLITRYEPNRPLLPPDPRRDTFYNGLRFNDKAEVKHPNNVRQGGLYGYRWPAPCTQSVYPYFYGAPGGGTIGPDCTPWPRPLRLAQGLVHPFRPVGMYYDQGSYVPIYDLDPLVPGPGSYPWPFYIKNPRGG